MVGTGVGPGEHPCGKQPLSLTMLSAELSAEQVFGASTWIKVRALHNRTGCMHPGGHDGLSKMSHGDFSRVLWVRMAQNVSRIIFAGGFLFKQVSSGEMQRGKVNHILVGSPITTFLTLARSVYHHNFPVSLSLPGEGISSMSPAPALGTVGNRAWDSRAHSELPPQQHFVPDPAPAGASQQMGLWHSCAAPGQGSCPIPNPLQGLCTKGSPVADGRGLDLPGPC